MAANPDPTLPITVLATEANGATTSQQVFPPAIPEPGPVAEAGVSTSEWKLALGFLAQLAATATTLVLAKVGLHLDESTINLAVEFEFLGVAAVVTYIVGRSIRKKGTTA